MPITCVYDQAKLTGLAGEQYGIVTRKQALDCGMTEKALRHALTKPNGWRSVLPGVYLTVPDKLTTDQRDMAALLYAGPGSVITGVAALRRHRIACLDQDVVDVLIPGDDRRKPTGFVRILRTHRMPEKYRIKGGLRFAYLPRAVGDAARTSRDRREVETFVGATMQDGSCTVELLVRELNEGPRAGTRVFRAVLADVTAGVRSAAEGDLKRLVDRSGIEKPMYNPMLYLPDGTFLCSPDLWWEKYGVAGEVDSLAYHFRAKDYEDTTIRHNRIERTGIHVLHWIPRTIMRDGQTVKSDIQAALAAAATRTPPRIITVPAGQAPPPGCRPPRTRPALP
jgi:hypothetical protein